MNTSDNQFEGNVSQSLWDRASHLFMQSLEVPPSAREDFLNRACGGDSALKHEVASLLLHDKRENDLQDVFQSAAAALIEDGSLVGQRIGAYLIKSELGHGGMGTVYLALRADDEYRKEVAVKVVRRGMDTDGMLRRFRFERQILAGLDHPYIARLLDGGTTANHQPFFVMEYVEGLPIDRVCRESQLSIEQICRLFLKVCEAVAYAHRNLVVHRDLKPGNIMVTADGAPKLLDFGVAKLLDPEAEYDDAVTGLFQRRLTPEYASPEQVSGLPVTTAADVYSLGAVLYELLTGERTYSITSQSASEWERMVCQEEVQRPSSRRRELRGDLDNILLMALRKEPGRRYSSVEQFASDIERFLHGRPVAARSDSLSYRSIKFVTRHGLALTAAAIVLVSLLVGTYVAQTARMTAENERSRAENRSRQADAARLLAEQEHLVAEQQRSLALKQAAIARAEKDRAQRRLTQLIELANRSLFEVHTAIQSLPGSTAARRAIVRTTLEYLKTLEIEAAGDRSLRRALGAAYLRLGKLQGDSSAASLGDSASAAESYLRAAYWIKPLLLSSPNDVDVIGIWIDIQIARSDLLLTTHKIPQSIAVLEAVLPLGNKLSLLSPMDSHLARLHQAFIPPLQHDHTEEAIAHARESANRFSKLLALMPSSQDLMMSLATVHSSWGSVVRAANTTAALEHFRESSRLHEDIVAQDPNNSFYKRGLMLAYGQIASVLGDQFMIRPGQNVEEARVYYGKAFSIAQELANADPINRLAQYDLASVELRLGALDPAPHSEAASIELLQSAIQIFKNLAAAEPSVFRYQTNMALAFEYLGHRFRDKGDFPQALSAYEQSLAMAEKLLRVDAKDLSSNSQALAAEEAMAALFASQGNQDGAMRYAGRAIDRAKTNFKTTPTQVAQIHLAKTLGHMAKVQLQLKNRSEARKNAVASWEEWRKVVGSKISDDYAMEVTQAEKLIKDCDPAPAPLKGTPITSVSHSENIDHKSVK